LLSPGRPGKGLRQPVHADDLAAAALAALDLPAAEGQSFNLGGAETLSYRQMIQRIFEALGQNPRFLRVPFLARLPGAIGAVAARMEQDLAFDGGEFWRSPALRRGAFSPAEARTSAWLDLDHGGQRDFRQR
jgi:UDP-glucose 4-epimerase